MFSAKSVWQLPAAEPRQTEDIGIEPPCSACALRHAAVHSEVDENDFSLLIAKAVQINLQEGQTLFIEGASAERLYSILRGTLMTYKSTPDGRRQITGFLWPGDILGLRRDGRYVCSTEAITQCSLYSYPMEAAEEIVQKNPLMEWRLLEITRQELIEAQEQMLLLGRKTAKERVAAFLIKLERQERDRGNQDAQIFLPMNRSMVGDYLGLSTETVSRMMSDFRNSGLISAGNERKVQLFDIPALESIANGLA